MGLGTKSSGGKTYVKTFEAMLVIKTTKDDPEAIKRINKKGDEVYERRYNSLSGFITGIDVVKSDYGNQLEISLLDGTDSYELTLPAVGGHAFNFYLRMENIDFKKDVEFAMWSFDNPYFAVMQDGKLINRRYPKEDVPMWEKKELNGDLVWDKTAAYKFFVPKIAEVKKQVAIYGNTAKPVSAQSVPQDDIESDLPF